jgi:hypothetical protein
VRAHTVDTTQLLYKVFDPVNGYKRTLERYKTSGEFPDPYVEGGGGKAAYYDWKIIRPWLTEKFGMELPEHYPR